MRDIIMYFATFFQFAVWPVGTDKVIEACGDRATIILDGRESIRSHALIASRTAREQGYVGYKLHKGRINGPCVSSALYWVYRYSAHTIDGSELFHAHTAQAIGDAVFARMDRAQGRGPHMAYTYDNKKGVAFPYTVWHRDGSAIVGTSYASHAEVCNAMSEVPA